MSFETEKQKVNKSLQSENNNQINAERVNKKTFIDGQDNYLSVPKVISLIRGYNFTYGVLLDKRYPFHSKVTVISGGPVAPSEGGGGMGG
jgi:hypothetical protein